MKTIHRLILALVIQAFLAETSVTLARTNVPVGKTLMLALPAPPFTNAAILRTAPVATNNPAGTNVHRYASTLSKQIRPVSGGARADFGRHKVTFSANASAARTLVITTPDGRTLSARPSFLALYDAASDQSLLIGEVTNRVGLIILPDQILYTNAFDGIRADLRLTYTKTSLEADVILHESPTLPERLNPANVRLEIWTEWFDSPAPVRESQTIELRRQTTNLVSVAMDDDTLNFYTMKIVRGKAFSLGAESDSVNVAKTWMEVSNRTFLVETIDYLAVKSKLDLLAATGTETRTKNLARANLRRGLPERREARAGGPSMRMASASVVPRSGVVLDFVIVNCAPVPPGIISWWRAADDADDAIANHNDGTLQGDATYDAGKVGQAFSFDGDGDFVEVPDAPSLNPTDGLTLDAWVYVTGTADTHRDIISKDGEDFDRQYFLTVSDLNGFRAHVGIDEALYYVDGTSTVELETWYHVAMTYNGTNLALYVNGVREANGAVSGTLMTTEQPVRIGGGAPEESAQWFFAGLIDEPDIFNRALSATEIQAIYNAGAAGKFDPNCVMPSTNAVGWWPGDGNIYDLARTNFGTLQDGATFAAGMVDQAFNFDGDGDFVEIADAPDLNPTDALTIETWVHVTGNEDSHRDIVSKDGEDFDRQYLLTVSDLNGFRAHVWVDAGLALIDSETTVELNAWYHVAMTYDGTNLMLYVNGELDSSAELEEENRGPLITTTQPVRIGGGAPEGHEQWFFAGLIDEPTIYDRALSGSEISAIYSAGTAGKCKVDSDYDGLTDLQEAFLGTDPHNTDTDGDYLSDGDEVFIHHTDPRNQDTDGDKVIDQPFKVFITRPKVNSTLP